MARWTASAKWGRRPLRLMASVPCRWASPLNEGLGLARASSEGKAAVEFVERNKYLLTERLPLLKAQKPSHDIRWFLDR
jgi:hypothetical protein